MRSTAMCLFAATLAAHAYGQCTSFQPAYPGLNGPVRAFGSWDPDGSGARLVAGGAFTWDQQTSQDYIAYWDGATWAGLGWGTDGPVNAITTWDPDGDGPLPAQLIIAGEFLDVGADSTGQVEAAHIASWDGEVWRPLGLGTDGPVYALTVWDPDGDGPQAPLLIVAGDYHHAGDVPADYIAAWDGTAWNGLGWGFDGAVRSLTTWASPDAGSGVPLLLAGGDFSAAGSDSTGQVDAYPVAAWDGTSWTGLTLPGGGGSSIRQLMTFDFDGNGPQGSSPIILCGTDILRWTGSAWTYFNYGVSPVGNGAWVRSIGVLNSVVGQSLWIAADTYTIRYGQPPCEDCRYVIPGPSIIWGIDPTGQHPAVMYAQASLLKPWDPDGDGPAPARMAIAGAGMVGDIEYSPGPAAVTQPMPAHVRTGGTAQFTFQVAGPVTQYVWYITGYYAQLNDRVLPSGAIVTGSQTATLTISNVNALTAEQTQPVNGNLFCRVHCIAGNECGGVISDFVRLDITLCSADFNYDGDVGTDVDINAFFRCLAGDCCATCESADFNGDGDFGTDTDIESFFRVLGGGPC